MAGIIVDIDSTLLRDSDGIDKTIAWVNEQSKKYNIYIITGRPESERAKTTRDLKSNGIRYNRLYMNDVYRNHKYTIEFKKRKAQELLKDDSIIMAIDNDADARSAYSSLGISTKSPSNLPDVLSKTKGFWQGIF